MHECDFWELGMYKDGVRLSVEIELMKRRVAGAGFGEANAKSMRLRMVLMLGS